MSESRGRSGLSPGPAASGSDTLTPLIAFLIAAGFLPELFLTGATRDDVYLEVIKVIGIAISAVASSFALYVANKSRRATDRVEEKVEKNRKTVRRSDHRGQEPKITIVEDRRDDPRDGERK